MAEGFPLRVTDAVSEEELATLHRHLKAFNLAHREAVQEKDLGIFYEDENGVQLAGLTGETWGNRLCIKYLCVDESLRGKGVGAAILRAAEDEGRRRGCRYAFVDTFSFQAPGFYKKYGYREVFALTEYPLTGARYYYTKGL